MVLSFFLLLFALNPFQETKRPPKPKLKTPPQDFSLVPGDPQFVTRLSFDGKEFTRAFNASAHRVRLVLVFSPTCPHCLGGASEVRQLLSAHPKSKIKVLVLWSPLLEPDSNTAAKQASAYLPDPRAEHFWDLWSYGVNLYTKQFAYPENDKAWDIFVVYKPHLLWRNTPPEPTLWLQHRNINRGIKYSKERLQEELKKWME